MAVFYIVTRRKRAAPEPPVTAELDQGRRGPPEAGNTDDVTQLSVIVEGVTSPKPELHAREIQPELHAREIQPELHAQEIQSPSSGPPAGVTNSAPHAQPLCEAITRTEPSQAVAQQPPAVELPTVANDHEPKVLQR